MATRQLITQRDEEIRRLYAHLRHNEKKRSSFIMELLSFNYFINKDRIYSIVKSEPDFSKKLANPSIIYKSIIQTAEI